MYDFKAFVRIDGATAREEDYTLSIDVSKNTYKAVFIPKRDISSLEFYLESPVNYNGRKVYANGYQSWTPSREFSQDEKDFRMSILARLRDVGKRHSSYGDHNFTRHSRLKGHFHGYSYGYISDGGNSDLSLIGSLNERSGFTVFYYNMKGNTIRIEKDLEGKTLSAGERYEFISLFLIEGGYDEAFDAYFAALALPKPRYSHQNGYTSWYNYYQNINEEIIKRDLNSLSALTDNINIFQIDDGYQTAVGDWLSINAEKFPNGMRVVSDSIHEKGYKAGLWLAPFGAQTISKIFADHPNWFIKDSKGKPLSAGGNWGGFYTLDIYNPDARAHIKEVFDTILNKWNFDMVKLDFLYEASQIPRNNKTRGQLSCEAMDFLRECVGDKLILGCGVPMWPAFGKFDFCRIGADVTEEWKNPSYFKETHSENPLTRNAVINTLFRRHLDGRAFCNDPDVCLLRDNNISLTRQQRYLLATINKVFGNLLFVSDDVGGYDEEQLSVFKNLLNNEKIEEKSAKYIAKDVVEITYTENGKKHSVVFNVTTGNSMKKL